MRNQLFLLLLVVACIALICSLEVPPIQQTVDGIRIGEDQAALEARLGGPGQPVSYFEDANATGWRTAKDKVFFGNHPEEADKLKTPLLKGVAYGTKETSYLPLVGYSAQKKVEWICGTRLNNRKGRALLSSTAERSPRSGYCMAGPCGWRQHQGQISISAGGESGDSLWTVLLLAPGPVSQRLAGDQLKGERELRELENYEKSNP